MTTFDYTMSGESAGGQTWETTGAIELRQGDFSLAFDHAMRDTFEQLTSGRAVFGKPGLGCSGPYKVKKFSVEERIS